MGKKAPTRSSWHRRARTRGRSWDLPAGRSDNSLYTEPDFLNMSPAFAYIALIGGMLYALSGILGFLATYELMYSL